MLQLLALGPIETDGSSTIWCLRIILHIIELHWSYTVSLKYLCFWFDLYIYLAYLFSICNWSVVCTLIELAGSEVSFLSL
jgi:hypothetical protein